MKITNDKKKIWITVTLCLLIIATSAVGIITTPQSQNIANAASISQELFSQTNTYLCTQADDDTYKLKYDMSQRMDMPIMDVPQITVLTHGLGGDAADWSNMHGQNGNLSLDYEDDPKSIINKLTEKVGESLLYRFEMQSNTTFTIYKDYNKSAKINLNDINNISKHLIIVFEDFRENNINSHNEVSYYRFNKMLSSVVLQVKKLNGGILPKVNLIGHSRGGLINLLYAMDHPDLVDSLVSIGTPYFSSTTANLFGEAFMNEGDEGLQDILDSKKFLAYNSRWNANYEQLYRDINAVAIGGYSSLTFLSHIIKNDNTNTILNELGTQDKRVLDVLANALNVVVGLVYSNRIFGFKESVLNYACVEFLNYFFPSDKVVDVLDILFNEMSFSDQKELVAFYNDLLVPLASQLAKSTATIEGGEDYKGFKRYKRYFTEKNCDFTRIAQNMPPAVHNLEPRDAQIISWVCNEVNMGVVNNKGFAYEEIEGGLKLTGFFGTIDSVGEFVIPNELSGKPVLEIGDNFLAEDSLKFRLKKLILPSTLKKIGESAFDDCKRLKTVECDGACALIEIADNAFAGCALLNSFPDLSSLTRLGNGAFSNTAVGSLDFLANAQILELGYYTFANCVNLVNIEIPTAVNKIDFCAFYNCYNLTKVTINYNVGEIGELAFANCPNLTAFEVNESNRNYIAQDGILFSKDKSLLLQYPIGKSGESFEVPDSVERIAQGAFAATSLSEIKLNKGLKQIGSGAFSSNSAIEKIVIYDMITVIEPLAFADCAQLKDVTMYSLLPDAVAVGAFDGVSDDVAFRVPYRTISADNDRDGAPLCSTYYSQNKAFDGHMDKFMPIAYTVNLNVDGVSARSESVYYLNGGLYQPTKEGHVFTGWYYSPNFGASEFYEPTDMIAHGESVNLYARWRAKQFIVRVSLDGNVKYLSIDGLTDNSSDKVSFGDEIAVRDYVYDWFLELAQNNSGEKLMRFELLNGQRAANGSFDYTDIFKDWNDKLLQCIPDFGENLGTYEIKPVFEKKTYTFQFDTDGGKAVSSVKLKFNDALSLPATEKSGYKFGYWQVVSVTANSSSVNSSYVGKSLSGYSKVPDFSRGVPCDTVVKVKVYWSYLYVNAKTYSGTEIKGLHTIQFDFKDYDYFAQVGKVFNVASDVKELKLMNMDTLTDVAFVFTNSLKVVLSECVMIAKDGYTALDAYGQDLDLYTEGYVVIRGGRKLSTIFRRGNAVEASRLRVYAQEGQTCSFVGGIGKDGTQSEKDGYRGGMGLYVTSLYIMRGEVKAFGGHGGEGYKGDDATGTSSATGGTGGCGGPGGAGIYIIGSDFSISSTAYLEVCGGDGGTGGAGGKGGRGSDATITKGATSGGTGGYGGKGGNGANATISVLAKIEDSDNITLYGGYGGKGGVGGAGGSGGKKYLINKYASNGSKGSDGADGRDGLDK